jgi:anti-sigma regulatory factor (Ser/Thr protein kinase)
MPETLDIAADLAGLARASAWAEAWAEQHALPGPLRFGLSLCLEEAISNIMLHGAAGTVRLGLAATPLAVTLTIADDGPAFDPLGHATPAAPASVEAAEIGGMGIHLMRKFAQELDYARVDRANRLTLRFDRLPAASGEG